MRNICFAKVRISFSPTDFLESILMGCGKKDTKRAPASGKKKNNERLRLGQAQLAVAAE